MNFGRSRREVNAIGGTRANVMTGRRDLRIDECAIAPRLAELF
jgi:hypothetical protein